MIKHVVMFKVKSQNSEEKAARINKLKKMLDELKSSIREVVRYLDSFREKVAVVDYEL
jgi:hypothetical protein